MEKIKNKTIYKLIDRPEYETAFMNISECLSQKDCIQEKCDRYKYCAGCNLSTINAYVEKLEFKNTQLRKTQDEVIKWLDEILDLLDKTYINQVTRKWELELLTKELIAETQITHLKEIKSMLAGDNK